MNEHNLDDLIIGDPAPVGKKSKSRLAIIALLIIVFLGAILLFKMIWGDTTNDITLVDKNQTTFVSPELIPIENNNNNENKNDLLPITKEKLPQPSKKSDVTIKTKVKKEPKKVVKKKEPTKTPKVEKTVAKKVKEEQTVKNPVKKQPKPSALFGEGKPVYYVQVGAFNREPNAKFIQKIKDAGFNYVINKNEKTRRVRVGPYGSYAEAKAALTDVNSSIGIMGFVVKQK